MAINEMVIGELEPLLASGFVCIDVREPDEYIAGHIPSAISIPMATIGENLNRFSASQSVYLVCKSGGRSRRACEFLSELGITNVVSVVGGTSGWAALGNALTTGDQP